MIQNLWESMQYFYQTEILSYFQDLYKYPLKMVISILDIAIVIFLIYKAVKILKETRAWQLLKGIAILIILTLVSGWLHFGILNYILTSVMMYRWFYFNCSIST